MAVTIKVGNVKYKSPTSGNYEGINALSDNTTADQISAIGTAGSTQVAAVNSAGSTQVSAVQAKGAETLESIPDDYTTLSNNVSALSSAISQSGTDLIPVEQGYYSIADGAETASANWCKTPTFVENIYKVQTTGLYMFLQAFDKTGEYIGTWDGSAFTKTYNNVGALYSINFETWKTNYPNYFFKLLFYKSATAITPNDVYQALTIENILVSDVSEIKDTVARTDSYLRVVKGALDNYIFDDISYQDAFKAYTSDGSHTAAFQYAPFVCIKNFDENIMIGGIKINIEVAGELTIGVYPRNGTSAGAAVNLDDAVPMATLTFESTGAATKYFLPFKLDTDHYLYIGSNTDTAKFTYGGTGGTDNGFLYNSNGSFAASSNFIGVDFMAAIANTRKSIASVYKGKKLSILGDSISTYSGYIPSGNVTYYPNGDVVSVTDTWWKKLIDALGMTLDTNNSWSGSYVSTANGETSAGCMTRCQNLGTPDVIIVWMGINDFNNEVPVGTYDGSTPIPNTSTTFSEAYGIMLDKILTAYPSAEVWVCTLPQCERNASEVFPEINGNGIPLIAYNKVIKELSEAFGVKVLDHNKSGLTYQNMDLFNPDQLHPNKYGHSLIANSDIRTMDNAIEKRYEIS